MDSNSDQWEASHPAILRAVGFADLEMWDDAAALFHSWPEPVRLQPGLHRLRLRISTAIRDWSGGPELAWSAALETEEDRAAAGRYLVAMARHYLTQDDLNTALACQAAAVAVWPESGMTRVAEIPDFSPDAVLGLLAAVEASCLEILARRPEPMTAEGAAALLDAV